MSGKELVRSNILMRLNLALDGFAEQRAGTSDVSSLLRQAIRAYERRLEVKRSLWQVLRRDDGESVCFFSFHQVLLPAGFTCGDTNQPLQ